jgi:hypothetical protein
MGGGDSRYVQDQERFVNANVEKYKNTLPSHYSRSQIKGKLRQLYANSDTSRDNKNSYILDHVWQDAKKKIKPEYSSHRESQGERRYH